jgi:hypothetical protein
MVAAGFARRLATGARCVRREQEIDMDSKILGGLPVLGQKNGMNVVTAVLDARFNGKPGLLDRHAIVAVSPDGTEAVAALTGQVDGGGWDQGHYFYFGDNGVDDMIRRATRKAIQLAGYGREA